MVTMDNRLIRASYRLSVNELRLLLVIMAQMPKSDEQLDSKQAYYVTKDDFVRLGCEPKNVAREIRNACSDLLGRKVFINLGYGIELHTHWVYNVLTFKTETFERLKAEYPNAKNDDEFMTQLKLHNLLSVIPFVLKSDENLMARIVLHEDIVPYVCQLKKNFTKINPEELARLGSFYSYRIYFLMMQWRSTGKIITSISDLRDEFELTDKYTMFADFKKRVLDVAVDEISKYTEYDVQYNLIKKGRKYTHVEFKFKEKVRKTKETTEKNPKIVDIFDGFTELERQTIQERIDEHIKRLEAKGETVGDFYRLNITNKAIAERWGLDVLAERERKKQAKEQERLARHEKELQEKQAEEYELKRSKERLERFASYFESLPDAEQQQALDAISNEFNNALGGIFKKYRQDNTAHKNVMFIAKFYEYFNFK